MQTDRAWRGEHPKDTGTRKRQGHSARTDSCEQAAYCCTTNPTVTTAGTAAVSPVSPRGSPGSCSLLSTLYLAEWRRRETRGATYRDKMLFKCWISQTAKVFPDTHLLGASSPGGCCCGWIRSALVRCLQSTGGRVCFFSTE